VVAVGDKGSTRASGGDVGYSRKPLPTTRKRNMCRKCHCCGFLRRWLTAFLGAIPAGFMK
jgi:hypothetical protein